MVFFRFNLVQTLTSKPPSEDEIHFRLPGALIGKCNLAQGHGYKAKESEDPPIYTQFLLEHKVFPLDFKLRQLLLN